MDGVGIKMHQRHALAATKWLGRGAICRGAQPVNRKQIYQTLVAIITAGAVRRMPGVAIQVLQRHQPTQQSTADVPHPVYLDIVNVKRYGFRSTAGRWIEAESRFEVIEVQPLETTVQVSTGGDVDADILAGLLQSNDAIALFAARGAQVLRVMDVRTTYYRGESDQWLPECGFDLIIKHEAKWIDGVPVIDFFEFNTFKI